MDAPKFGGVFDSIASGLGKVSMPDKVQQAFLYTSKEGAEAVYPLEASVLAGRTQSAYNRDGWMEVQERVFEEAAAAVIWLKGVDWLKAGFNRGQLKVPGWRHLNPDIAWNRPWGKLANVDLTAQEMFSKDGKEIGSLLKVKSARWAFSVGLALAGVAVVVPTLNQLKTRMIMSHQMSRRKRSQEGDNVQFGDPNTIVQPGVSGQNPQSSTGFGQNGIQTPSLQPVFSNFPFRSSIQAPNSTFQNTAVRFGQESQNPIFGSPQYPTQAGWHPLQKGPSNQHGKNPQFGGLPGGSLVEGLGHMVEQTPYGSILVVDAGIAGGRSYVASKRSGFETVEVLVRDIGSLYFYILSVPHIMAAMSKGFDAVYKTSSGLEPKIAEAFKRKLEAAIKKEGLAPTESTQIQLDELKSILHGRNVNGQLIPEGWLKTEMRKAKTSEFMALLEKEANVYLSGSRAEDKTALNQAILNRLKGSGSVMPEQIQGVLDEIKAGKGEFAKLSTVERKDLGLALKQAFRHNVGVSVSGLLSEPSFKLGQERLTEHSHFKAAMAEMGETEGRKFADRLRRMAQIDGLDQAHSMLRRSINMLRGYGKDKAAAKQLDEASQLANWLDQAKNRAITLDELQALDKQVKFVGQPQEHVKRTMAALMEIGKTKPEKALLETYQKKLAGLLSGEEGRLFSLAIHEGDAGLTQKLREMLQGGLHNDTAFLREAQGIVSQFNPDSREFANTAKAAKMRESISRYGDTLLSTLEREGASLSKNRLDEALKSFVNLNRNLNYASRSIAMVGTMFCLGWLVPHVQTTITKRLTGKDKNPGIASAAEALGYGKDEKESDKAASKSNAIPPSGMSLNRNAAANGIFVGQTPQHYIPRLGQNAYQS